MRHAPSRLLGAAATLLVLVGAGCAATQPSDNINGQTACTMEARQCPDGSYVGRGGPNCEFSPCPDGSRIDVNLDAGAQTE